MTYLAHLVIFNTVNEILPSAFWQEYHTGSVQGSAIGYILATLHGTAKVRKIGRVIQPPHCFWPQHRYEFTQPWSGTLAEPRIASADADGRAAALFTWQSAQQKS